MRWINPGSVISYIRYGNLKIPKNIQCECPGCRETTEFLLNANYQNSKNSLITESKCPSCKKSAVFIIMTKDVQDEQGEHADTYIYDLQASKHQINHMESLPNIPKDLIRAYRSALNVHQARENSATAVLSKRVIESILKHFLGDNAEGKSLPEQLELLPQHVDLAAPIQSLSQLFATHGSLHEMFELEVEMDYETTTLLMDLLESLIEYLFFLPGKIEVTHAKIMKKFN